MVPQCQKFGLAYKDIKEISTLAGFSLCRISLNKTNRQVCETSTPGCTPQHLAQHMLTSLCFGFFRFREMCTFRGKCTTSETLFSVGVPMRKRVHTQGNSRRMFQGCGLGQETTEERVTAGDMEGGRGTRPGGTRG